MGGWNSGRSGGTPIAEHCRIVDLAWMFRRGWLQEGCSGAGGLSWSCGGEPSGNISYRYDLFDRDDASLTLNYRIKRNGEWQDRQQFIRLTYTVPPLGGRRWWMICPVRGHRVGKLYMPGGGDMFAGRKAWRIGYRSQRTAPRDRASERLFALQSKLGSERGWEQPLFKPKGMWQRTFDRHMERYLELDALVAMDMMAMVNRLQRGLK